MKVKFADKTYEVLYIKEVAGKTLYAVEDEPNHIDWLVNVEVIDKEEESKDERIRKELIKLDKPIWSEFDDLMLKDALEFIETGWSGNGKSHLIYWLKSIKDRIK